MRSVRQSMKSPRRHGSQRPQLPPNQPTPTRCPSAQPLDAGRPRRRPRRRSRAPARAGSRCPAVALLGEHVAVADAAGLTRTRTSPRPGSGASRSDELESPLRLAGPGRRGSWAWAGMLLGVADWQFRSLPPARRGNAAARPAPAARPGRTGPDRGGAGRAGRARPIRSGQASSTERSPRVLFGQEHVQKYRETDGEVGHDWQGTTVLILTTKGRRSGEERPTPLIYQPLRRREPRGRLQGRRRRAAGLVPQPRGRARGRRPGQGRPLQARARGRPRRRRSRTCGAR